MHSLKISLKQKILLVLLGLFLFILLLEFSLRLGGWVLLSLQEYKNRAELKEKSAFRILCLGESTTFGFADSYPSQLQEILNQRNLGIKFSVINKGLPATTTSAIRAQLPENLKQYQPDMVITMIGINDSGSPLCYRGDYCRKIGFFLKNLQLYKLARLLYWHLKIKCTESGIYQAEELGKSPLDEENSSHDWTYVKLGKYYKDQSDYSKAKEMFIKAIEKDPANEWAYLELEDCYKMEGNFVKVEELLKKAIAFNPQTAWAYAAMGWYYRDRKNDLQAVEAFEKAIAADPRQPESYLALADYFTRSGEYVHAEEILKKLILIQPKIDLGYAALGLIYLKEKSEKIADEYLTKANTLRKVYYNPQTKENYLKMQEILSRSGVRLICVQYPMRSVELLKRLFPDPSGIIFVDNENIFKEAVRKFSYVEYFSDNFAGDFGHCTLKGNRLLAENIANVLEKDFFRKK